MFIQGDKMQTNVKKWGNSLAIRLPNAVVENLNLSDNNTLEIKLDKNKIILNKKDKLKSLLNDINESNLHSDDFELVRGKEW